MNFSNYQNLRSLFTAIGNKLTHRPETIEISQSEYDQLTQEQKADKSKVYYIYDADSDVTSLAELSDTSISNLSNGQLLSYDSTASKWKNVNPPADAVSDVQVNGLSVVNQQGVAQITVSVPNIEALNNVDVSNLGNGQILKYNSTSQEWQNADDGFVILSYGNSTWNDFITAYQANNIVYCRASSNSDPSSGSQTRLAFMAYVNDDTNPTEVEFQYYRSVSSKSSNIQGDQVFIYKLTNSDSGTWTVTTRSTYTKIVAGTNMTSSYGSGALTLNANVPVTDVEVNGTSVVNAQGVAEVTAVQDNPTFTEAQTKDNIASGESFATILGKIKKFFTDLKTVAFTGAYSDLSGTENVAVKNANNRFTNNQTIDQKDGTTSSLGGSYLVLGNDIAQGTEGNSYGRLRIYGTGTNNTLLQAPSSTANRTINLPDASGTVALTSDVDVKVSKSGDTMTGALNINHTEAVQLSLERNNTSTSASRSILSVGNNVAEGTVGNSYGAVRMYGKGTNYTILQAPDSSTTREINLPNASGTVALTSDIANMVSSTTAHNIVVASSLPSDAGSHTDTLYLITSS